MSESRSKPTSLICSTRLIITLLSSMCLFVNYLQRVNLTQTIVSMTENHTSVRQNEARTVIDWNRKEQGTILASYFYGYILTQAIGGVIAFKFGSKCVLLLSVLSCSILTIITPVAAKASVGAMIATRLILGLFAGVNWPACSNLLSEWSPKQERSKSRLIAVSNAGAQVGTIVALPMSGILSAKSFLGGWPLVFYASGSVGLVWVLIWAAIASSRPDKSRIVSSSECEYICRSRSFLATKRSKLHVPYKSIITSLPCWGMFICHFFKTIGYYTILTNISIYSRDILGLNVKQSGFLGAIPFACYCAATLTCGYLSDKIINSGKMSRTSVRKLFTGIGSVLPGIFVFFLGFVTRERAWAGTLLFTLVLVTSGFTTGGGMYCSANDMAPRFASIIWGISNTFGNIPGIICPTMVGLIVRQGRQEEWRIVFAICSVSYFISGIVFVLVGSGDVLPWAKEPDEEMTEIKSKTETTNV